MTVNAQLSSVKTDESKGHPATAWICFYNIYRVTTEHACLLACRSFRKGSTLSALSQSMIRTHVQACTFLIVLDAFSIVGSLAYLGITLYTQTKACIKRITECIPT